MADPMADPNLMQIAHLHANLLCASILYARFAQRAGDWDLRDGADPAQTLDNVVKAIEWKTTRHSIEYARILAMGVGVDIAGFQAAVDARFLAQMQGQSLSVGSAQGLVDVRGSLEAPGINHVLAEWEPETVAAAAGGEITEEDYNWMMSALPALQA
ncbi:hypothetical protein FIBSPDRAFT_963876 [Athelia psychrophila]|uniref:Uncharacterized protein n=1 Tax=Athelia psychrophila TaxID=1759441 RepID=A0A165YI26_9AGAM|nr:hypothetical protein FIBSPDRAFT_963876 [Fibularhizoctonia sp. CBS 109695]